MWYLFIPTCVYETQYPMKAKIDWLYFAQKLGLGLLIFVRYDYLDPNVYKCDGLHSASDRGVQTGCVKGLLYAISGVGC